MLNILMIYIFVTKLLLGAAADMSCTSVGDYFATSDKANFQLVRVIITLTDTKNNYLYSTVAITKNKDAKNQFKIFKTIRAPIVPEIGCAP